MIKDFIAKSLATVFGLGYFPLAAGSLASIVGGLIALMLRDHPGYFYVGLLLVIALGFWASARVEQVLDEKDPSCIVIDEVAGAMIAFWCLPMEWRVLIPTFFLFRAFDMFKIYPANILEDKENGVGVMMDDLSAGLYTFAVMQLAVALILNSPWRGILY